MRHIVKIGEFQTETLPPEAMPMTPYEREIVIRTIMGEALNEGPEGWAAVGHVIKNRSSDPRFPSDPASVALQPKQFSAWNEGHGGNAHES